MFGKLLVNEGEFQSLKQRVENLEEKFHKQEVDEFIKVLEKELGVGLIISYSVFRGIATVNMDRVYDRNFASIRFVSYKDLLISLEKERDNIKNAVKSYLYDKKKEEEILYGKV